MGLLEGVAGAWGTRDPGVEVPSGSWQCWEPVLVLQLPQRGLWTPRFGNSLEMGRGRTVGRELTPFLHPCVTVQAMICTVDVKCVFLFLKHVIFFCLFPDALNILLLTTSLLYVRCLPGKRKALKLNFANPPFKSTARFTLNTSGVPFQNPHM